MALLLADSFFRTANLAEAALWGVIAVAFALAGLSRRLSPLPCVVATVAFALFGLSDVVETRTGAWWRPWWLLAWKAACVAAFLALFIAYVRYRRRLTMGPKDLTAAANPETRHAPAPQPPPPASPASRA